MIFKQYYLEDLAHASYLIADEETQTAVVVDPQRDVQQYLDDTYASGMKIQYVLLTHFHADFVAGHIELRDRADAKICLGPSATAEYDFRPLKDGEIMDFGKVRFEILHTPGHTPEAVSVVIYDFSQGSLPYAVLTGDTLFIGDVGRPDLMASSGVSAKELSTMLYGSLHEKILNLPDTTFVYPGHGAGSMCGKQLSDATVSSIGEQRKANYALQPMAIDEFVTSISSDQAEVPKYFHRAAMRNREECGSLESVVMKATTPLSFSMAFDAQQQGVVILDTRDSGKFFSGHFPGSINVGFNEKFSTWAGTVLTDELGIILVVENPGHAREAAISLARIGFDNIMGHLSSAEVESQQVPALLKTAARMSVQALHHQLEEKLPLCVLDVRSCGELMQGIIPGSTHIPLNKLEDSEGALPRDRPIVVYCASGYRSAIAVSMLRRYGREDVSDLVGGYASWERLSSTL